MNTEEQQKTTTEPIEEKRQCALWTMLKDFYGSPPSVVIAALVWSIIFLIGAIYTGVEFFRTILVQYQIMYAAGFICFVFGLGLIKIFSWEIINRNRIERDIKRLEVRISQWPDTTKR